MSPRGWAPCSGLVFPPLSTSQPCARGADRTGSAPGGRDGVEPPHRCRRHAWLDRHGNDETVRGHTGAVSFTSPQSLGEADTPCEAAPQGPPAPAGGEGGLRAGRSTGRREAPRGHRDGSAPTRTFPEDWWATATKAHWEGRERKRGCSQEAAAAKRGCRSRQGRGERGKQGASTSKSAGDSRCCEQAPETEAGNSATRRPLQRRPPAVPARATPRSPRTHGSHHAEAGARAAASRLSCSYRAGVRPLLPSAAPAPGPGSNPAGPGRPPRAAWHRRLLLEAVPLPPSVPTFGS